MKLIEDVFCMCFLLVSSIALLCELGNASIITVRCKNSKTFCLKHTKQEASFIYTLTADDLEFRCNSEGSSIWFRILVVLGILCSLVVYCVPLYACYYKLESIDLTTIFPRLVHIFSTITAVFIILLIMLPIACYFARGGERGFLSEVWASPLRGVEFLVWNFVTAPLHWALHDRLRTPLDLDKLYPNITCVEPGNDLRSCPTEFFHTDLSSCDSDFYCTRDCCVAFPKIVINSLGFILALLAIFYRLLVLSHHITRGEMEIDLIPLQNRSKVFMKSDRELHQTKKFEKDFDARELNEKCRDSTNTFDGGRELIDIQNLKDSDALIEGGTRGEDLDDHIVQESCVSEMKDKSAVAMATKPKKAELSRREKDVYPRGTVVGQRLGIHENTESAPKINKEKFQQAERLHCSRNGDVTSGNECPNGVDEELNVDWSSGQNLRTCNGVSSVESKLSNLEESSSDFTSLPNEHSKKLKPKSLPTCKEHEVAFAEKTVHSRNNTKLYTNGRYYSEQQTQSNAKQKSTRFGISNGHLKQDEKIFTRKFGAESGMSDEEMGSCNDDEEHRESSSDDIAEDLGGIILVEDETEFYMSGFRL